MTSDLPSFEAPRWIEIPVGLLVLAVAGLFAYFGIGGAIAYLHGSRAAPADPVACGIGIVGGVWFGFLGLRLITGWHEDRPLLPNAFLFCAALGAIGGAVWFAIIAGQLHKPMQEQRQYIELFGLTGAAGLVLWWRRVRRGA